ncbi:MAG TPA: flagellar biosynthesis protein FlhA, partial [Bacillota bacterium]|nr:flagellar biosynthesis protein FlhA [Bacillota bacterium]
MTSTSIMSRISRYSDIISAAAIISMVILMVIIIPAGLLDILITVNISVSLVVLLTAMYNRETLSFSVFPTLLLVTTLFRLSLNVSSTRLILLNGEAGKIIATFGSMVLGGNAAVGFVIFLILVVIQFLVITKGAERVSEVAARFTLDAMPGKQMAIDADLNSGIINEQEAKKRRKDIQGEADFYGAMDGASKFVKGDAIAAIVIIIINIIGGFVVGMVQKDLGAAEALSKYTILTVGEGLVAQIPALLISVATGIMVTRAGSDTNLGQDLFSQLLTNPRVLGIAAAGLGLLAVLGMPPVPMLTLAGGLGAGAYYLYRKNKLSEVELQDQELEQEVEETRKPENVVSLLHVDSMELELGYS